MKDIPIIFSAPMVNAMLAGRKTMTRRIPTPQWRKAQPGDRLWVRENIGRKIATSLFGTPVTNGVEDTFYAADNEDVVNEHGFNLCPWWKSAGMLPCIHMPRWASRLTLVVTAAKIEPVNQITEEDAEAEGMREPSLRDLGGPLAQASWSQRQVFGKLWCHLHGLESWQQNPEVVALTFTVHKVNIDRLSDRGMGGLG